MTDRPALKVFFLSLIFGASSVTAIAKENQALQAVQMPFVFHDDRGSEWDIQPDGTIGDGGNDLFDTGGQLTVGDRQFAPGAAAQMDPTTNELVFSPMQVSGVSVSRRVGCNAKQSYIRYTEILENKSANPVKMTVRINFNMGGSVQSAQLLVDEKKSKQPIGMVIGDQSNCFAHIGAGRGSKLLPRYQTEQGGGDNVDVFWDVEIPAKKSVAVTHLVVRRGSTAEAAKVLEEVSEKDIIKEMSPDIASKLANFRQGERIIGDEELLRGELFDVIELRGGDQYKGTIKQETFKLKTFYGMVDLPADKIISEFTAGQFRPRQLLVTRDGEIFGGQLDGDTIKLELSNGQITSVPLSQISRMGYRKRADEPEEIKFDKPFVSLRGGDRMIVSMPTSPIMVATRYGNVSLKPEAIAVVIFASDEHAVHEIQLTDGSKFVGIVTGESFPMKLASGQDVNFPASSLRRLQLAAHNDDLDADTATLNLTTADQLVGKIAGELKLQTAFDTLTVNGGEIRTIQRNKASGNDVQITLWDGATLSGQLDGDQVGVALNSGRGDECASRPDRRVHQSPTAAVGAGGEPDQGDRRRPQRR